MSEKTTLRLTVLALTLLALSSGCGTRVPGPVAVPGTPRDVQATLVFDRGHGQLWRVTPHASYNQAQQVWQDVVAVDTRADGTVVGVIRRSSGVLAGEQKAEVLVGRWRGDELVVERTWPLKLRPRAIELFPSPRKAAVLTYTGNLVELDLQSGAQRTVEMPEAGGPTWRRWVDMPRVSPDASRVAYYFSAWDPSQPSQRTCHVAVTDRRTGQTRIVADLQAPPIGLVPAPEASAAPELPPQWIDENWLLSDALFADDQDEVDAVRGAIIRAGPAEPGDDAVRRHYGLSADGTRHSPWTWRDEPESLFLYGAESDLPCVVAVFKDGSLRLERWDAERKRLRRLTRYRHGRWARPTTDAILLAEQVEPEEEGQRPGTRLILWTRRKGRNDIGTLPWLVRPEDLFLLIAPSQSE